MVITDNIDSLVSEVTVTSADGSTRTIPAASGYVSSSSSSISNNSSPSPYIGWDDHLSGYINSVRVTRVGRSSGGPRQDWDDDSNGEESVFIHPTYPGAAVVNDLNYTEHNVNMLSYPIAIIGYGLTGNVELRVKSYEYIWKDVLKFTLLSILTSLAIILSKIIDSYIEWRFPWWRR
jgi:hypothetical protein